MLVGFAMREVENWGQGSCFQTAPGPLSCFLATFTPPRPPRTHQTRLGPRSLLIQYPFLSSEFIFQMDLMIWLVSVSLRSLKSPPC